MDLIGAFNNHLPVRIRFGEGVGATLPAVIDELGAKRIFVMVDEGIEKFNPAADIVLASLAGRHVTRFDKPAGEPTIEMVDDATAALKAADADVVVALGGGSVIDTLKAARLCAQLGMSFREFLAAAPGYPVPTIPLIAMPTSAGTGSEVSGGSVVSDPEAGKKNGIANANLRATYALVDPLLTASMPPSMTANTGIDALAQAIAGIETGGDHRGLGAAGHHDDRHRGEGADATDDVDAVFLAQSEVDEEQIDLAVQHGRTCGVAAGEFARVEMFGQQEARNDFAGMLLVFEYSHAHRGRAENVRG